MLSSSLVMFFLLIKLLFFLLLLLLLTQLYLYISRPKNKDHHYNLPPTPLRLPIIGNFHLLLLLHQQPYRTLFSYSQTYGPLMLIWIGTIPSLIISSADAARDLMKTHDTIFADRPYLLIFDKLFYNGKDIVSAPYGEYWRQIRAISVVHLLSNSRVKMYHRMRIEEVGLMVEKIHESVLRNEVVNLTDLVLNLANDVVCRVAFGRKRMNTSVLGEMSELLGGFYLGEFIPWLGWINRVNGVDGRIERVKNDLDEFLEGIIHDHQQVQVSSDENDGSCKDFVDVLLQLQRNEPNGLLADMESIKAIILDVFFAGTDTTFSVLEWTMSEILKHRDVMKQLQNEVRATVPNKDTLPNSLDYNLDNLIYLRAVIKETIRLHPPVPLPVPRQSTKHIKSRGFDIPKGTRVITNVYAIQRDPAYWYQPEEFRPQRFLEDSMVDFRGQHFQLIPFGAGRRICPGINFAMEIIELTLATLLSKFDWTLPSTEGYSLDMTETSSSIIVHRKNPLLLVPSLP